MKKKKYLKIELTKEEREEAKKFLQTNSDTPASIIKIIQAAMLNDDGLAHLSAILSLKLEMKLVPSSEKCHVTEKKTPRKKRNDKEQEEYHREMANMHRRKQRAARKRQQAKAAKQKTADTTQQQPITEPILENDDADLDVDVDDEVESEEFIRAQTQAGKDTDQAQYAKNNFSIFATESSLSELEQTSHNIIVPVQQDELQNLGNGNISSTYDTRQRINFVIDCYWMNFLVETATNTMTGDRVTASTRDYGPEGTQLTWQSVVNVIVAVVGYAIPMRRLERLLGEQFSTGTMVNIIDNFARKLVPVYSHLSHALANAEILSVDDTPTRINEVTQWKKELSQYSDEIKKIQPGKPIPPPPPKPWEEKIKLRLKKWEQQNQQRAGKNLPQLPPPLLYIFEILKTEFKFEFEKKNGEGEKISLNTTVVHGRIDPEKPYSRVVIYRTHFGNAGNFLDIILQERLPKHKELIIHGDMSSNNNVNDPLLLELFAIKYAGCLAHARRDFFRYRDQDKELTDIMLSGFAIISNVERMIDSAVGRNSLNTRLSRQNIAKTYWESILGTAHDYLPEWSKLTPLGKAIRYLINNYENLTMYLDNPKLEATNNDSENLLRWEALADASSFGCDTVEGRMRLDIIRTGLATCACAQADARVYILFIFLAKQDAIVDHPEHYTPQALVKWIMHTGDTLESQEELAKIAATKALNVLRTQFNKSQ